MNAVTEEQQNPASINRLLILTGWAGLIGAVLVGVGEFTLQFSQQGGYEAEDYSFFARISEARLTAGHFFSVLAAPLYLLGYWHIGQMFVRGGSKKAGWTITLLGGYAFVVGTAWLGGRIYLALTAHALSQSNSPELSATLTSLLAVFAEHNEPLVNALRLAMLVVSVLWIALISRGKTLYPRWMAIFSPIVLLGIIFITYFKIAPALGAYLLPAAMNVVHVIIFGLSIFVLSRKTN
ncbi:MAG: hypothetical protein ACI92G_001611 [Candidatus Pelagisphaera sp.]|jgi:hypothetical protein